MELKANITEGFCGDLRYFFDTEKYSIEDFKRDYLNWKEIRPIKIERLMESYLIEDSSNIENTINEKFNLDGFKVNEIKSLDLVTQVRVNRFIKELKEEKTQGYQNFYGLVLISTSKFLSHWLSKIQDISKLDQHYKQFLTQSGNNRSGLYYFGSDGKKYYISQDAIYLTNETINYLLNQKGNFEEDGNRLTDKVQLSEKVNGFVNTIFQNEISNFFHRRNPSHTGFEHNLTINVKRILEGRLGIKEKKFLEENKIKFFVNKNTRNEIEGFALKEKHLDSDFQNISYPEKYLVPLVNIISKKPKVKKPSASDSSIEISKDLSKEEREEKVNELIHIESKWRVFSGVTLVEILFESAKALDYVSIGFLNEAFKQALSIHQYDPNSLLNISFQQSVDDEGTLLEETVEDKNETVTNNIEDWKKLLIETPTFGLSPICQEELNNYLENLKDEDNNNHECLVRYFQLKSEIVQENIEDTLNLSEKQIEDRLKMNMGKNDFQTAEKELKNITELLKLKQSSLNMEGINKLNIFAGIMKYLFLSYGVI